MTYEAWNTGRLPDGSRIVAAADTKTQGHDEVRIAELTLALEDAQRLLAFAGCPTDWIDKVLRGSEAP